MCINLYPNSWLTVNHSSNVGSLTGFQSLGNTFTSLETARHLELSVWRTNLSLHCTWVLNPLERKTRIPCYLEFCIYMHGKPIEESHFSFTTVVLLFILYLKQTYTGELVTLKSMRHYMRLPRTWNSLDGISNVYGENISCLGWCQICSSLASTVSYITDPFTVMKEEMAHLPLTSFCCLVENSPSIWVFLEGVCSIFQ